MWVTITKRNIISLLFYEFIKEINVVIYCVILLKKKKNIKSQKQLTGSYALKDIGGLVLDDTFRGFLHFDKKKIKETQKI